MGRAATPRSRLARGLLVFAAVVVINLLDQFWHGASAVRPGLLCIPLLIVLVHLTFQWRAALLALVIALTWARIDAAPADAMAAAAAASLLLILALEWRGQQAVMARGEALSAGDSEHEATWPSHGIGPVLRPPDGSEADGLRQQQSLLAGQLEHAQSQVALGKAELDSIREVNLDLTRRVRGREELLSLVSHDLRSALNAMVGWLYLARLPLAGSEAHQRALDGIESAVNTQRRLVEQLLDASRMLSGKVKPVSVPVVVDALLDRIRTRFEARTGARAIDFTVAASMSGLMFNADPVRVEESLTALLDQALAITPDNGWLQVHAEPAPDPASPGVRIRVETPGTSLAIDDLDDVFAGAINGTPSPAGERRRSALSLSMAIARAVTQLQGGAIGIEAMAEPAGTRLWLLFRSAPGTSFDGIDSGSEMAATDAALAAPETLLSSQLLGGSFVLLVDDRGDMLELSATLLRGCGAHVTPVGCATDAIRAYRDWASSGGERLVMSDLSMPELDGLGLIRQLRQIEREHHLPRLPAVALSAQADLYSRREVIEAGFDLFLAKPIPPRMLIGAIAPLIGR